VRLHIRAAIARAGLRGTFGDRSRLDSFRPSAKLDRKCRYYRPVPATTASGSGQVLPDGVVFTNVSCDRNWAYRPFFTRPAVDESDAVFAPPPASDFAQHGSPADGR
jgi:hypothetical protein